jgi:hypothetical protein
MNIFILSENCKEAAKFHCDKHVVKMILESTQMLATAAIANGAPEESLPVTKEGKPYRATHANHPCTRWASESMGNYFWLHHLLENLCIEYQSRYGKIHSCESNLNRTMDCARYIPFGFITPFPVAISEDAICRKLCGFDSMSTVQKYRAYYLLDKAHMTTWKNGAPEWAQRPQVCA